MKAVGILGSPRKRGNSSKMLLACLEELSDAGFDAEFVYLQEKDIKYCYGCGTCLRDGECIIEDEMRELKEMLKNANALVLASPVYFLNVSAQMKCFIDRMLAFGHRPTLKGYGGSIVTYAGVGEPKLVAEYLNRILKSWGIYPVGYAIGFGVMPGDVKEEDVEKAKALGKKILGAFKLGFKPEPTREDFLLQEQLINLIKNYKDVMEADYEFWKERMR